MEYTKKDLLKMKKKLYNLVLLEKRYNSFVALTRLGTIGCVSGTAVSFCMYLEDILDLEKSLTIGGACLAATGICAIASHVVGKEADAVSEDLFEYEANCPDGMIDEVYDSIYKRR